MPKRVDLDVLGDASEPRVLQVDDNAKVGDLKALISEATGVPAAKIKLVGKKGMAMTSLGDGERVPKTVKVGGVASLSSVGEEAKEEEAAPAGRAPARPALSVPEPKPREVRQPRVAEAKPKPVSKEEAAAKAAARKARIEGKAAGKAVQDVPKAASPAAAPAAVAAAPAAGGLSGPSFNLEQAQSLQDDMKIAFSMPDFQEKLGKMHWDTKDLRIGERNKQYRALLLEVQKQVIPKYGFEASQAGVGQMLTAFFPFNDEPLVNATTNMINTLIDLERAGQALYHAEAAAKKAAEDAKKAKAKAAPPTPPASLSGPSMTKDQLLRLQLDLIAGYNDPVFQKDLRALPPGNTPEGQAWKNALLARVQMVVLPKHGFPATPEGLLQSSAVFTKEMNKDPAIAKNNEALFMALTPEMQDRRSQQQAKAGAATKPQGVVEALRWIEISLNGTKELPCKLAVESDSKVGGVRKLIADATGTELEAVKLLYKSASSKVAGSLDDKVRCPGSVLVSGPEQLVPGGVLLTLDQARALTAELQARYAAEAFQKSLRALAGAAAAERRVQLRDLCLAEQRAVLPKYGFEGSREGVMKMMMAFLLAQKDASIKSLMDETNDLLTISDNPAPEAAEPEDEEEEEDAAEPEGPEAQDKGGSAAAAAAAPTWASAWMNAMGAMDFDEDEEEEDDDGRAGAADEPAAPPPAAKESAAAAPVEAAPDAAADAAAEAPAAESVSMARRRIELKFMHDDKETPCTMLIEGSSTATAVRKAIAEATGDKPLDVKLVRKQKNTMMSLDDTKRVPDSVMVRGVRVPPRGGLLLGKSVALALQGRLRDAYSTERFQAALTKLVLATEDKPGERAVGMQDLTFLEQRTVLPEFGLEATKEAVNNILLFFQTSFLKDQEIQSAASEINDLISYERAKDATMRRWVVVGGAETGGIIVRKTAGTASPQLGRLATGAVVKEVQLSGERLHYQRVSGDGPDDGWVSLSFKGAPLVKHAGS